MFNELKNLNRYLQENFTIYSKIFNILGVIFWDDNEINDNVQRELYNYYQPMVLYPNVTDIDEILNS